MNGDLVQFLEGLTPLATETAVWGNGRFPLEITYYLSSKQPPLAFVATADQFIPEAIKFDHYVVESRFWYVKEIRLLLKNQAQVALLDAAIQKRHNW